MIEYIKGAITFKNPAYVVVETGGVGYHLNVSLHTYAQIEKLEQVKLLTHQHIKEDAHTLFGFADDAERTLFRQLISVSGVGPSTAQVLLSSLQPDEAKAAIVGEDVSAFRRVKGIGPKTAKRIILDLKDKVLKDGGELPTVVAQADNTMRQEALSGLVALGFNRTAAQKALNKVLRERPDVASVEELIKLTLNNMG